MRHPQPSEALSFGPRVHPRRCVTTCGAVFWSGSEEAKHAAKNTSPMAPATMYVEPPSLAVGLRPFAAPAVAAGVADAP